MTTNNMRKIQPIDLRGVVPKLPTGPKPQLLWVAPTSLLVDETYQRGLSKESYGLIRRMAAGFAWNRIKPPIVVDAGAGALHVIDGQHTAIAAASIELPEIPVFKVAAADQAIRAAAFVGHNTDRLRIAPITVYQALLAAGDPDAQDVANVCRRAGVRIRNLNQASMVAEGDSMAIGTIRALIKKLGVRKSRCVLEALVKGRVAPLSGAEIMAADKVMHQLAPGTDIDALAAVVRRSGPEGFLKARADATRDKRPVRDVLADRWAAAVARSANR